MVDLLNVSGYGGHSQKVIPWPSEAPGNGGYQKRTGKPVGVVKNGRGSLAVPGLKEPPGGAGKWADRHTLHRSRGRN